MAQKGLLKVAVLQVTSQYFKDKDYKLSITADGAIYTHEVTKGNQSKTFGNKQYFPVSNNLKVKLFQNLQTDDKIGYFLIPMAKLYELPGKNHLIDVSCTWKNRGDGQIIQEVPAIVNISVMYENTAKGHLKLHIKQAKLDRDTQAVGKMDPFVICKIGEQQFKTKVLNEAGKTPKWNQLFICELQTIPNRIQFEVWDEDLTNNDLVGSVQVNPQQDGYFVKGETERAIQINFQGKKAGDLFFSTQFQVVS